MTAIPATLTDRSGRQLSVERAWPRNGGRLIFEAVDVESGQMRAGSIGVDSEVRVTPFAEDPVLSGLPVAAAQGDLLVHRYKRRAVVRDESGFTKLLAPGKAEGVAVSHRTMRLLAGPSGLVVPDVVRQHAGGVTLTAVSGTSFHDLAQTPVFEDQWGIAWQEWAQRWPQLAVAKNSSSISAHTARDESRTVARWVNYAQDFGVLPVADTQLQRTSAQVARLLISGAPQPPVLSHRDLHDKQLLFDSSTGAVGLIDCDTVAVAEPALDLANLLVHVDFRKAQGIYSAAAAQTAEQAVLTAAAVMGVPDGRLRAYAAATRLRLACLYAFRPRYQALAHRWFEGLETDLAETVAA